MYVLPSVTHVLVLFPLCLTDKRVVEGDLDPLKETWFGGSQTAGGLTRTEDPRTSEPDVAPLTRRKTAIVRRKSGKKQW